MPIENMQTVKTLSPFVNMVIKKCYDSGRDASAPEKDCCVTAAALS